MSEHAFPQNYCETEYSGKAIAHQRRFECVSFANAYGNTQDCGDHSNEGGKLMMHLVVSPCSSSMDGMDGSVKM